MWKKLKTRMFSSSNIQVMSNAILKASKNLRRDFGELEKLQNSNRSVQNFVNNSYLNTKDLIKLETQILEIFLDALKTPFFDYHPKDNIHSEQRGDPYNVFFYIFHKYDIR